MIVEKNFKGTIVITVLRMDATALTTNLKLGVNKATRAMLSNRGQEETQT